MHVLHFSDLHLGGENNRGAIINRLTREFSDQFCLPDGHIAWERLVEFISTTDKPRALRRKRGA